MWIIQQGTTRYVYATCREKSLLVNPYYVVKFVNDLGKNPRYCILTDVSSYPIRTQKFSIVETTTPTALTNQVNLNYKGKWEYFIYESAVNNSIDTTGLTLVERGKLLVTNTPVTRETYVPSQTEREQYVG